MSPLIRFLEAGTAELQQAFERAPETQSLVRGDYRVADYRCILERLRRGFAAVELQAFDNLPKPLHDSLKGNRTTWRLSHDIGLLGGTEPLPARLEDVENAGVLATNSAKIGAHFALAQMLEILIRARDKVEARLGPPLLSCLLFNVAAETGTPRFGEVVRQVIEQAAPEIDWTEAMAGARRAFRTIRHGMCDEEATAR